MDSYNSHVDLTESELVWSSIPPTTVSQCNTLSPTTYDIKQFDGDVPVIVELWGHRINPLLISLQGPLWPGMVAPDRVLSMSQKQLNSVLMLNWIVWNRNAL